MKLELAFFSNLVSNQLVANRLITHVCQSVSIMLEWSTCNQYYCTKVITNQDR